MCSILFQMLSTGMTSANSGKMSDKTEEEEEKTRLEAELREMTERKKVVFEMTREADECLRKIREEERQKLERLQEIRCKEVERDLRERHVARLEAEKKTAEREAAELRVELEALKTEYDQLKQTVVALSGDENKNRTLAPGRGSEMKELELLRRKNCELKESLEKLKGNLHRVTSYSRTQRKEKRAKDEEIKKLARSVKCLEDEISAAKQISAETQLRQLNELQSPSEETTELKQTLTSELRHYHHHHQQQQQQQQPAAEEHHPSNSLII